MFRFSNRCIFCAQQLVRCRSIPAKSKSNQSSCKPSPVLFSSRYFSSARASSPTSTHNTMDMQLAIRMHRHTAPMVMQDIRTTVPPMNIHTHTMANDRSTRTSSRVNRHRIPSRSNRDAYRMMRWITFWNYMTI